MYIYKNEKISDISVFRDNYHFISFSDIAKKCGVGFTQLNAVIAELKIEPECILRLPSNTYMHLYTQEAFNKIKSVLKCNYKNDKIPAGYISKKELSKMFNVQPYTINNMARYFSDFNKYAEYFFVENIKTKFFLINDSSYQFYKEKIEIYKTPYSERLKQKQLIKTTENTREYAEGNLHKIAFDYDILAKIFDTQSRHFNLLIKVYKKYAKLQTADSSIMDKHHIIPRFYNYSKSEDIENTIYLPREIHLLVHLLEYRCSFPDYKSKFFSAFCILSGRTDYNKICDNAFNEIEKAICNSLDIY